MHKKNDQNCTNEVLTRIKLAMSTWLELAIIRIKLAWPSFDQTYIIKGHVDRRN